MNSFGDFLRNARKKKNLTQEQAAEKTGVSSNTIQNWETDKYKPKNKYVSKLAEVYGVSKTKILYMLKEGNWPGFLFDESTNAVIIMHYPDIGNWDKEKICDFIDGGNALDGMAIDLMLAVHMNIEMKKALSLLPILERGDIHWTDDNINNSGIGNSKDVWVANNRPREDVPEEFRECESYRTIPLRKDLFEWYKEDSEDGTYKKFYIRISDKGRKLLQWWREK